jgi:hypothetical protein
MPGILEMLERVAKGKGIDYNVGSSSALHSVA